jgi:hypothetical protein
MTPPFAREPVAVARPPRRIWLRLLVVAALVALALLGALFALWTSVEHWHGVPLHVVVDGEEVFSGVEWAALDPARQFAVAGAALLGLLALAVLLPLMILALLLLALGLVLAALGLPLLAVLLLGGILLSPLLLLGWATWRLLKAALAPPAAPATPAARGSGA